MLDIQECSNSEVQKHPVSRNQYPESANTGNGFRCNDLDRIYNFMQLKGLFQQGPQHSYHLTRRTKDMLTVLLNRSKPSFFEREVARILQNLDPPKSID